MAKWIKYNPNGAGFYRIKLDPQKLAEEELDNNRWRDVLDTQVGWQNWTLDKDTTLKLDYVAMMQARGETVNSRGFIYIMLRDKTACFAARLFLDMCAGRWKDGMLYEFRGEVDFPEPKRQFVTKREPTALMLQVQGWDRSVQGYRWFTPTVAQIKKALALKLEGDFTVSLEGTEEYHWGFDDQGVSKRRTMALVKVTSDDRLARNRLSHYTATLAIDEEVSFNIYTPAHNKRMADASEARQARIKLQREERV